MSNQKKENNISTSEKVTNFLSGHTKLLAIIFIVLVLGFAVYFVTAYFVNKSAESNFALLSEYQQEYADNITATKDETSFDKDAFLTKVKELASSSGFSGAKAAQFVGDLYYEDSNYENAIEYYQIAAKKSHNSYLEPILLFTLGSCYEQIGDQDKAIDSYLSASKIDNFPYKSHAIFSVGRIEETRGNIEQAKTYYNELIENNPYSDWSNLAKSSLVELN